MYGEPHGVRVARPVQPGVTANPAQQWATGAPWLTQLNFRNLADYVAKSLLHSGDLKPKLQPESRSRHIVPILYSEFGRRATRLVSPVDEPPGPESGKPFTCRNYCRIMRSLKVQFVKALIPDAKLCAIHPRPVIPPGWTR